MCPGRQAIGYLQSLPGAAKILATLPHSSIGFDHLMNYAAQGHYGQVYLRCLWAEPPAMREDPGTEGDGVETCDNPLVRGPNCDPGPSRSRAQDVAALQADPVTRTDPSSSRRTALPSNPSNPSNPSGSSIQSALPSNPSDRLQLASTARQERRPHNHAHSMPSHTLAHPRGGAPAAQRGRQAKQPRQRAPGRLHSLPL